MSMGDIQRLALSRARRFQDTRPLTRFERNMVDDDTSDSRAHSENVDLEKVDDRDFERLRRTLHSSMRHSVSAIPPNPMI